MQPIRSILVPVDFSDVSANTLQYALRLADYLDIGIDLLHVVPLDDGSRTSATLTEQGVEIGKEKMTALFTEAVVAITGQLERPPAVQSYFRVGGVRMAILHHAKVEGNELIIMGADGVNDLARKLFGTNTTRLVNKAVCPVLVVPEKFTFRPLYSICYATDLSRIDALKASYLVKALSVFKPRMNLVHVMTRKSQNPEFNIDRLRKLFDWAGSETRFHVLKDADVTEEVFAYAQETDADLIVMHFSHHGWLNRLFVTSITNEATLETDRPLLILPGDQGEEE